MKPVKTKDSNARLVLPEEEGKPEGKRRGDLHVERMFFLDEETGEQRPGFESRWEPTAGERKALVNGAPVTLRLWGVNHPPVNMVVGDPPEGEQLVRLVTVEDTEQAASKFFESLAERMKLVEDGGEPIDPAEIPTMFAKALREVMQPPRPSGGNGAGPAKQ